MTSYRDLPPGRSRALAYVREIQFRNLQELNLASSHFQRSLVQPISTLVRRPALRRSAFSISRPTIINGRPIDSELAIREFYTRPTQDILTPLEEVTDTYEYLSELPNVILNLISEKLINLSSVSMNYFNNNFCVICQENIQIVPNPKSITRILVCTHVFHIDCIDKWFTTNKTCPTCKYTFD